MKEAKFSGLKKIVMAVLMMLVAASIPAGCGDSSTPESAPDPTSSPEVIPTPTISPSEPSATPTQTPVTLPSPDSPEPGIVLAQSSMERILSPDVAVNDLDSLVSGNNSFAFDLYTALASGEGNLFFSPYSISAALAMTYAGARGDTESQMADTLHFNLVQHQLHPAFNALDLKLTEESGMVRPEEGDRFTLNIANSIWGQQDYQFLPEFLDTIAMNYGAGLRLVDFVTAPEPARIGINNWVSEQTEKKIQDLIPQGAIDSLTRMVLANAIYFNASWIYPFDEQSIRSLPFNLLNGEQVDVSMMSQTEGFSYVQGDGYQVIELPYTGHRASMLIIVPDSGKYEAIESAIDEEQIADIVSGLAHKEVDLTMPKFSYESDFSLAQVLNEMGMPAAFVDADFSGMDGTRDLFISDVFHKAFVDVDENGTEAAAATAVIMSLSAAPIPVEPIELTIDRPFLFLIRDTGTDSVLFMGRVLNPS